jgi:hypothetical protein
VCVRDGMVICLDVWYMDRSFKMCLGFACTCFRHLALVHACTSGIGHLLIGQGRFSCAFSDILARACARGMAYLLLRWQDNEPHRLLLSMKLGCSWIHGWCWTAHIGHSEQGVSGCEGPRRCMQPNKHAEGTAAWCGAWPGPAGAYNQELATGCGGQKELGAMWSMVACTISCSG